MELGKVGAGSLVGELGLYTLDLPRSASVIAEEEVVAIILEPTLLDDPRAQGALRCLERRAMTLLSQRVRRNTGHIRRLEALEARPQASSDPGSFIGGISRAFRKLLGGEK